MDQNNTFPLAYYQKEIKHYQALLLSLKSKKRWLGILRLILFVGPIVVLSVWPFSTIVLLVALSLFAAFLFLVIKDENLRLKIKKNELIHDFLNREKESCGNWDFTGYEGGDEYNDVNHPYAMDLNLFGHSSLFQLLNKSHPELGQELLANRLRNLPDDVEYIKRQQHMVKELSEKNNFRKEFWSNLRMNEILPIHFSQLRKWFSFSLNSKRVLQLRLTGIFYILFIAAIFSFSFIFNAPESLLIFPLVLMAFVIIILNNRLNQLLDQTSKTASFLKQLSVVILMIEEADFSSEELRKLQGQLLDSNGASRSIRKLSSALKSFEYRQNLIVGFILNYFVLWDVWSLLRIEKWKRETESNLWQWIDIISQMDANVSLGQFGFNHIQNTYPKIINEDEVSFTASKIGHPFIPHDKRVNNDYSIKGEGSYHIITGANMAGKSTFLRTIGVNLVLAGVGAPVFADVLEYRPMKIFTSMLTVDNLSEETSYFLAEVTRLQKLKNYIQENPYCIVIMDEILKGTNSKDKEEGSGLFLESLIKLGASGIIATHDLKLTELADKHPDKISNFSFEVEHLGDQMQFDYLLRNGVTRNMNALKLMKQKGLIN